MSGIAAAASFFKSTIGMEHSPDTRNEYKGREKSPTAIFGKNAISKEMFCW